MNRQQNRIKARTAPQLERRKYQAPNKIQLPKIKSFVRDRPPEFSKMKIFFGTSVSDTLKPVDYDGPNRFSQIDRFLC